MFAHGQAYVALSRVKSLAGIMLLGLIKSAFRKNDHAVHREYERLAGLPIVYLISCFMLALLYNLMSFIVLLI